MSHIVPQPEGLDVPLYPHQLNAIGMMEEREKILPIKYKNTREQETSIKSRLGVFADITGYGKTFAIIGLLLRDKMKTRRRIDTSKIDTSDVDRQMSSILNKKASKLSIDEIKILLMSARKQRYDDEGFELTPTYASTYIVETTKTTDLSTRDTNCNLILLNNSLIQQWERELSFSTLRVGVVKSSKTSKEIDPDNYDVILCTPSQINTFANEHNKNLKWKRFIFDEPTGVRVSMSIIYANFYWLISATPDYIRARLYHRRNHYNFIQKLLHVSEQGFKRLIVKNDDDFVRSSYVFPETIHRTYECAQPLHGILNGHIGREITDMIAADNIEGAIEFMGGRKTDNIIDLITKRYEDEIKFVESRITFAEARNNVAQIRRNTLKKEELVRKLTNIKERLNETLTERNCKICYEDFSKPILVNCCQNVFCGKCILSWFQTKRTCPMCRKNVTRDDMVYIKDNGEGSSTTSEKLTKIQTIQKILDERPVSKIIIFSAYDQTFNKIKCGLTTSNIFHAELKGSVARRGKIIRDFKTSEESSVLFLNSNYNGAGINLQETTDIILYHQMDDDMVTQITGRANRIGRKTRLTIHQLTP